MNYICGATSSISYLAVLTPEHYHSTAPPLQAFHFLSNDMNGCVARLSYRLGMSKPASKRPVSYNAGGVVQSDKSYPLRLGLGFGNSSLAECSTTTGSDSCDGTRMSLFTWAVQPSWASKR